MDAVWEIKSGYREIVPKTEREQLLNRRAAERRWTSEQHSQPEAGGSLGIDQNTAEVNAAQAHPSRMKASRL